MVRIDVRRTSQLFVVFVLWMVSVPYIVLQSNDDRCPLDQPEKYRLLLLDPVKMVAGNIQVIGRLSSLFVHDELEY